MKVEFWVIGKTNEKYLKEGIAIFEKRLRHYLPFEYKVIPNVKQAGKLKATQLKEKEGDLIFKALNNDDYLILLDERGKELGSVGFSTYMEKLLQLSKKRVIFLVGGAFGFGPEVYNRADAKLSLSKMTFSHQMIRLFFVEQLYRAMTILRNEAYHNE